MDQNGNQGWALLEYHIPHPVKGDGAVDQNGNQGWALLEYHIPHPVKGDGAERDLILLRTQVTSTVVIGLQFISTSGGGGVGIQDGWTKFRWPVPYTSEKKL